MQFVDMKVYGLFVVERVEIEVEFQCVNVFFRMLELEVEVLH